MRSEKSDYLWDILKYWENLLRLLQCVGNTEYLKSSKNYVKQRKTWNWTSLKPSKVIIWSSFDNKTSHHLVILLQFCQWIPTLDKIVQQHPCELLRWLHLLKYNKYWFVKKKVLLSEFLDKQRNWQICRRVSLVAHVSKKCQRSGWTNWQGSGGWKVGLLPNLRKVFSRSEQDFGLYYTQVICETKSKEAKTAFMPKIR